MQNALAVTASMDAMASAAAAAIYGMPGPPACIGAGMGL
jgi:hypothetical protein